jgi:hypothetical protein
MLDTGELAVRLHSMGEQILATRVNVRLQKLERRHDVLQAMLDDFEEAYSRSSRSDCLDFRLDCLCKTNK